MKALNNRAPFSIYIGSISLLCLLATVYWSIIQLNNGLLVYTLDDPYIHLALAENIWRGHYGINMSEFSAPSSSILWPFILAPFSSHEYSPLLMNIACSLASIIVLQKGLDLAFDIGNKFAKELFISTVLVLFILTTNAVGLAFSGMEHSLQVLIVLLIAYGLIIASTGKVTWWLLTSIIVAPLIRYECLAISLAALFYIGVLRHFNFKLAAVTALSIAILVVGFSIFLGSLGLDPFPSSVVAKSNIIQDGGALSPYIKNLKESLHNRQGVILCFGILVLSLYSLSGADANRRQLALITISAASLHLAAGRFGWYNRYEIYILAFTLFMLIYIFGPSIAKYINTNNKSYSRLLAAIIFAGGAAVVIGAPYIRDLRSLPIASNNIYEQQYQMHRFAVEYYNMPVAVNDLGYVSYKNNKYVLDLYGLGSEKALKARLSSSSDINWIKKLTEEKDVGLAMIYESWFRGIPSNWIKLGELQFSKELVTPASNKVDFYATKQDVCADIAEKLQRFSGVLPSGVKFVLHDSCK